MLAILAQVNRFLIQKYPGATFEDLDPTARANTTNGHGGKGEGEDGSVEEKESDLVRA